MFTHLHCSSYEDAATGALDATHYEPLLPAPALEEHRPTPTAEVKPGDHVLLHGAGYWVSAVLRDPRTGRHHLQASLDPESKDAWLGSESTNWVDTRAEEVAAAPAFGSHAARLLHLQWLTNPAFRQQGEPIRWSSDRRMPMLTVADLDGMHPDSVGTDRQRVSVLSPYYEGTISSPYLLFDKLGNYLTHSLGSSEPFRSPVTFLSSSTTRAGHVYAWREAISGRDLGGLTARALLPVEPWELPLLRMEKTEADERNAFGPSIGWESHHPQPALSELEPLLRYLRPLYPQVGIQPNALSIEARARIREAPADLLEVVSRREHPAAVRRLVDDIARGHHQGDGLRAAVPWAIAVWAERIS